MKKYELKNLPDFYRDRMGFNDFYGIVKCIVKKDPKEFIRNPAFIEGCRQNCRTSCVRNITYQQRCWRKDIPVWFGNINKPPKLRILVVGEAPRATDKEFDVEQSKNVIFAAVFGADRWNAKSTVKGKPQNKYFKKFKILLNKARSGHALVIFTDCLKKYQVNLDRHGQIDKARNDKEANKLFERYVKSPSEKRMFKEEVGIIKPTHIIALSRKACCVLNSWMIPNVIYAPHPAAWGKKNGGNRFNAIVREIFAK